MSAALSHLYQMEIPLFFTAAWLNCSTDWKHSDERSVFQTVSGRCIIGAASAYGCFVLRHVLWDLSGPHSARESQHMDNTSGIMIHCCGMIKKLVRWRGESRIYSWWFYSTHTNKNPRERSCKAFLCVMPALWCRIGFLEHEPFKSYCFLVFCVVFEAE